MVTSNSNPENQNYNRVLFVNPPNIPFSDRSLLIEPIDIISLATYIQSLGNNVKVLDMDVKQMPVKSIEDTLLSFNPNVVVIPFDYHIPLHHTAAIKNVTEISQIAKSFGLGVVVGGKTPKHYPEQFLDNGADVVISGEMETALKKLLNLDERSKHNLNDIKLDKFSTNNLNYSQISNIIFKDKNSLTTHAINETHFDLNELPTPDRSLVNIDDYIDVRSILSSRGCDEFCGFCPTKSFWGNWRARSPKKVVKEIKTLVEDYNADKIIFLDDNATIDDYRMRSISDKIIDNNIYTTLGCLSNVNNLMTYSLRKMYTAGFRWIHNGAESGSKKVLNNSNCLNKTPRRIRKVVEDSMHEGFRVRTSWIYDLPGTDKQAIKDTNDLILKLEPQEIRIHYLCARAGTTFQQTSDDGVPSQYIHSNKPQTFTGCNINDINNGIEKLTDKLESRDYLIVKNVKEWDKISRMKDPKFISFVPARYGIGWER
jgi:anaerobic magnesium-protoporphyrin IX monomethyl ester cyclase